MSFALQVNSDKWDLGHFEYLRDSRVEVVHGAFPAKWCRFACLVAGYFLGVWQAGEISTAEMRLAEAIVPGFMWQHSAAFDYTD